MGAKPKRAARTVAASLIAASAACALCALFSGGTACNRDDLSGGLSSTSPDGGVIPCVTFGASKDCLGADGCSWLQTEGGFACYFTSCTNRCDRLSEENCVSCLGCQWTTTPGSCVEATFTGYRGSSCSAAADSPTCHAHQDCAWVVTREGASCVNGYQGPHS